MDEWILGQPEQTQAVYEWALGSPAVSIDNTTVPLEINVFDTEAPTPTAV